MPKLKEFVQGLQNATGKAALPVRFWADYSEGDAHTFKDALDKYHESWGHIWTPPIFQENLVEKQAR